MNTSLFAKAAAVAAVALGSIGIAQAAHAETGVYFSFGVPAYVESAPVYVPQQQTYVYGDAAPVYVRPGYDYDWRRDQWRREQWRREQWREHERREHERREHQQRRWGDRDGD